MNSSRLTLIFQIKNSALSKTNSSSLALIFFQFCRFKAKICVYKKKIKRNTIALLFKNITKQYLVNIFKDEQQQVDSNFSDIKFSPFKNEQQQVGKDFWDKKTGQGFRWYLVIYRSSCSVFLAKKMCKDAVVAFAGSVERRNQQIISLRIVEPYELS